MTDTEHLIDFERIEEYLRRSGLSLGPAECHGSLCGLLCATDALDAAAWARQVLAGGLDVPDSVASPAHGGVEEGRALLSALYKETADQLNDPEYGFSPLLPDDDEPLRRRVEALSHWCQGFLLGLALGGVQDQSKLPGDSDEVMRDLVEISRLGHGEAAESNEDETAFAEIVEYVRMAVLLVYEELRPLREARPDGEAVH